MPAAKPDERAFDEDVGLAEPAALRHEAQHGAAEEGVGDEGGDAPPGRRGVAGVDGTAVRERQDERGGGERRHLTGQRSVALVAAPHRGEGEGGEAERAGGDDDVPGRDRQPRARSGRRGATTPTSHDRPDVRMRTSALSTTLRAA